MYCFFFFFNDTATTEIYTLSLHDAFRSVREVPARGAALLARDGWLRAHVWPGAGEDRKSTRLNSSHSQISYAVFCLKKKNKITSSPTTRSCFTRIPASLASFT